MGSDLESVTVSVEPQDRQDLAPRPPLRGKASLLLQHSRLHDIAETEAVEWLFSRMEAAAVPIVRKLDPGLDTLAGQDGVDLLDGPTRAPGVRAIKPPLQMHRPNFPTERPEPLSTHFAVLYSLVKSTKPWPIVLMARSLDLGGSERQLSEIAMALDPALFRVAVACFSAHGSRADELRRAQIPVVEFAITSFAKPHAVVLAWAFVRWLRRRRAVIVHPFDVPTTLFAVPLARIARVPVVLASQRGDRRLFPWAYRRALRLTDRLADGLVLNSKYVRGVLSAEFGLRAERMHTLLNGVDTNVFHPAGRARRPELPAGGSVIGVVTVLRSEKSLETLLDAFARLHEKSHQLVIVGDGPSKEALLGRAQELKVADRCVFVPATFDVASWYRSIDVFVLPSTNESFSNSLMEAMACGCAVVASNIGGNPELVRHDDNGLLFEAGDASNLAHQLDRLLSDAVFRESLASAAIRTIHARFTREVSARRFAVFYEGMLRLKGLTTHHHDTDVVPR